MRSNAELLERIQQGDSEAADELITNNMGLVYSVAKRFLNRMHDAEDLIQIGAIGLIKAVKKFDCSFGVQFSTYAVPMIIGEIKRFLRDDGVIKVSRSIKENAAKGRRAEEALRGRLNRNPSIAEISDECGIPEEDLLEAFESAAAPESLETGINEKDENSVKRIELLASDDTEEKIIDKVFIREALAGLNEREKNIIMMRYYRGKTQSEIAQLIGVSQVQISRLEKKALMQIRENAGE
ncbi:MAG: SigB/SigF/SigG family RNA polymerase sigma factor [Oscillospiraceae bacterium]|nr:SigB/SigF/SigG family RNA polymerase sigma factor [Oscillospiraceae bacterium]